MPGVMIVCPPLNAVSGATPNEWCSCFAVSCFALLYIVLFCCVVYVYVCCSTFTCFAVYYCVCVCVRVCVRVRVRVRVRVSYWDCLGNFYLYFAMEQQH